MNQGEHTVSSFDTELSQLERRVLEMGGLAEAQLAAATLERALTFLKK